MPVHSLRRYQIQTFVLLFGGYAAYYFCRSDFSVAMPLMIDELRRNGMSAGEAAIRLGTVSSLGVAVYAAGKFSLTGLGDLWGGKRNFVFGLAGAVFFSILFATGGTLPVFTLAWLGNRFSQSGGWAGLIKVCSQWFGYSSYGRAVGILSLSYLCGDALARQSMGALIKHGYGWRMLFNYAACVAALFLLANLIGLHNTRAELGFRAPETNPHNLFCDSGERPESLLRVFRRLLSSRSFLTVCLLSFGTTIVRETFGIWTPTYLNEAIRLSAGSAAVASAVFPAVGALSVLLAGWLSDRLHEQGRSLVMLAGLTAATFALLLLAALAPGKSSPAIALVLIGLIAFCLLGPYSYLAGAFALDFGGRSGSATASGLIDGVGYLGGILAGDSVARTLVLSGWSSVFATLAVVCALSASAAAYLFVVQRRFAIVKKHEGVPGNY